MPLPLESEWLRANVAAKPYGVDRDKKVIRGYVLAQRGPFKSQGRGEFDDDGLRMAADLINAKPNGVKSRFAHPSLSGDGIGKLLGRSKNARVEDGKLRGDLHLDPTSFNTPDGNLGQYVMDLAESDPEAFGSSLVLKTDKKYRLTEKGDKQTDGKGEPLPPLWYPLAVHASDVVDDGDAVHDGFLSVDLPDFAVRKGAELLDQMFPGQPREVVEARCQAWLGRYLEVRYGPDQAEVMAREARRERLKKLQAARMHGEKFLVGA